MNRAVIIADTSCLIVLQNIRELSLLHKLFGKVFITEEVETEFGTDLPEWIKVKTVNDKVRQNAINLILDAGEASAISLALETDNSLLIIDEKKGRRIAQELGLNIVGTLGIILLAKKKGLIESAENLLQKLESADFRISEKLRVKISDEN